jgi:hypothetical protein
VFYHTCQIPQHAGNGNNPTRGRFYTVVQVPRPTSTHNSLVSGGMAICPTSGQVWAIVNLFRQHPTRFARFRALLCLAQRTPLHVLLGVAPFPKRSPSLRTLLSQQFHSLIPLRHLTARRFLVSSNIGGLWTCPGML